MYPVIGIPPLSEGAFQESVIDVYVPASKIGAEGEPGVLAA